MRLSENNYKAMILAKEKIKMISSDNDLIPIK